MEAATAKDLARALSCWLEFQRGCKREALFSESFISQPVGEFLQAHHSGRVQLEWDHPNLNPLNRKGRPRQVDFALFSKNKDRPVAAVEAKWAETAFNAQRFLDDVLRLECVRNEQGQHMTRYFLFSGETTSMQEALGYEVNSGGGRKTFLNYVLPLTSYERTIEVKNCDLWLREYYQSFASTYTVEVPLSFRTTCVADETAGRIRTLIWKIGSMKNRQTFAPSQWT